MVGAERMDKAGRGKALVNIYSIRVARRDYRSEDRRKQQDYQHKA
jgi:hypothetical protein